MKILFVEDDDHTSELIAATLRAHYHAVDRVADGETGLEMALQWTYDLVLLDVMLPKLDGIEVCRQLRTKACQAPILILTARGANADVIAGLDAGADDYLVKPCEPDQLMARVRALLRRAGEGGSHTLLTWGGLCLDPSMAQVTFNQAVVPCRPKEYSLLELFLRHPQRLLSRTSIIDHLWSYDDAPIEGTVTTLVKDLRRRLSAAGLAEDPIETVYGLGYRWKLDPQAKPALPLVQQPEPIPTAVSSVSTFPNPGESPFQQVLQGLDAKFRDTWTERLAVLEMAVQALRAKDPVREQQQAALANVHKLVGGLGTFGYEQAAAVAETLEESLMQHLEQEAQWTNQFSHLLAELKQALSQASAPWRENCGDIRVGQDE